MGADCRILLPSDTSIKDIVNAIGLAAGCSSSMTRLSGGEYAWLMVEGIRVEPGQNGLLAMCPQIIIDRPCVDGEPHSVMFHAEGGGMHGMYRLLLPPSTPFWIAIGIRLIETFGGKMDANDCDSSNVDFSRPKPRKWNDPQAGAPWKKLQRDISNIKPITMDDMWFCRKWAGYPDTGFPDGFVPRPGHRFPERMRPSKGSRKSNEVDKAVDKVVDLIAKNA